MKKLLALVLMFFSLILFTKNVEAKILPQARLPDGQAQKSSSTSGVKNSRGGIGVYPSLRADRRALIVNFSNLGVVSSVSYFLTYRTSTQDEGAGGKLNLSGKSSETAELLFGTCSKGVCRYHVGIRDARLEVNYTTKSGKKYIKRFKIRV